MNNIFLKKSCIFFFLLNVILVSKISSTDSGKKNSKNQKTKNSTKKNNLPNTVEKKIIPINSIKALVFGNDETHIITEFDITRPSIFEGRFLTEKEYIERILTYEDAKKYKIPVDEATVDKYLEGMQKEHNLTPDDMKNMFLEAGFTYQEGRKALKILYTNSALLGFKVNDRLIVSESAIEKYYKEHPEIIEASYLLQITSIDRSENQTNQELKDKLNQAITENKLSNIIPAWPDAFWIQESDISQEKKAITQLNIDSIWMDETETGFDLYRLKDKKEETIRPLDIQKRKEISELLREPVYEQIKKEYEDELWNNAAISYPKPARALSILSIDQPQKEMS